MRKFISSSGSEVMVSSPTMLQKSSIPSSSLAVALSRGATSSLSSLGIQTIREMPPSAAANFFEAMKCRPWPMKPGV